MFVNATIVYQFKDKDTEIKDYVLCFGNVSNDFTINNKFFLLILIQLISANLILLIVLLPSIINASNHTKCVLLSNQKCMIQHTLINSHPNEYNQGFLYHPFSVKLDRYVETYSE